MQLSRLMIASLASSLVGLFLIYITALTIPPVKTDLASIDASMVGRIASTTGYITHVGNSPQGHMFLTISENSTDLQVPLFAGYIQSTKTDTNQFKVGRKISVTGLVDEYQGQL